MCILVVWFYFDQFALALDYVEIMTTLFLRQKGENDQAGSWIMCVLTVAMAENKRKFSSFIFIRGKNWFSRRKERAFNKQIVI